MSKGRDLVKFCKTVDMHNRIAITNTQVERATKVHRAAIKVVCDAYPGEVFEYSVDELLKPDFKSGPWPDKFTGEGYYYLYYYYWKGSKHAAIPKPEETSVEEPIVETVEVPVVKEPKKKTPPAAIKVEKNYVIKIPKVITTTVYEEESITLTKYIGMMIRTARQERGWHRDILAEKAGISKTSVREIEDGNTNPFLSSLASLAEVLDYHITDLFPPKE